MPLEIASLCGKHRTEHCRKSLFFLRKSRNLTSIMPQKWISLVLSWQCIWLYQGLKVLFWVRSLSNKLRSGIHTRLKRRDDRAIAWRSICLLDIKFRRFLRIDFGYEVVLRALLFPAAQLFDGATDSCG